MGLIASVLIKDKLTSLNEFLGYLCMHFTSYLCIYRDKKFNVVQGQLSRFQWVKLKCINTDQLLHGNSYNT